jgi:hypothetical protein
MRVAVCTLNSCLPKSNYKTRDYMNDRNLQMMVAGRHYMMTETASTIQHRLELGYGKM